MKVRMGKDMVDTNTGQMHIVKQERFTKTMTEVWRHVNKSNLFTASEERALHRLSMFLQLHTNALTTPNGEYMTVERMADETGIDRSNIRKTIKELMRKNAVGRWASADREIYYLNPFLFQNGDIKPFLFNLFDKEYHERCREEALELYLAGRKKTSLIRAK